MVWIVTRRDCEYSWIEAVYHMEELALAHVSLVGGEIEVAEVKTELDPEATSREKQKTYIEEKETNKRNFERRQSIEAAQFKLVQAMRPEPPHMSLCHCQTFTERPMWTKHGYCLFCGGWSPPIFLRHMGSDAMYAKISDLGLHDRRKMIALLERVESVQSAKI